jgi:hypothetical protein
MVHSVGVFLLSNHYLCRQTLADPVGLGIFMRKSLGAFHEYGMAPVTPAPGRDTPSCCIRATHVLHMYHSPVGVA